VGRFRFATVTDARESRAFVTVVSGLPRSGTSLVMQMLQAGGMPMLVDDARAPDADNPRGYFEYAAVKGTHRDASWVSRAEGRAVKVIHALVPALPAGRAYRVIVMRRPLAEVLRSQARMLARREERQGTGPAAGEPVPIDDAGLGRTLAAQLEQVVAGLRARERTAVLDLAYPELVARPREASLRVDAFLGGGLDVDAMAAAVEPGLHRNRSDLESC
jgi:hypothetical protein